MQRKICKYMHRVSSSPLKKKKRFLISNIFTWYYNEHYYKVIVRETEGTPNI